MKNNPVKLAALISGIILLTILLFIQYFQKNSNTVQAEKKDENIGRDILKEELLMVEPASGQEADDIEVYYDVIEGKMEIIVPNATENYSIEKVKYGSPYINSVSLKNASEKVKITVDLKESCSYTKDILGNRLYIHLDSLENVSGQKVIIDPGHGGKEVGAGNNGIYERDINLKVAKQVKNMLEDKGYITVLTRESNKAVTVESRVDFVNKIKPTIFISIHCNDSDVDTASGTEVLYNTKDKSKKGSKWLADILCRAVVNETGTKNRGLVEGDDIHIIRNSKVPVALIEMGFVHSKYDFKLLSSKSGQGKFAQGIATGIITALEEIDDNQK